MRTNASLFLASFFVILGVSFAESQVSVDVRFAPGQPPAVMAHRSAKMGGMPENSLAWIESAIDRGVDIVHINPQLTADGEYVLMHDHTLNRTTDVEDVFPFGPPNGPTRKERGGKDYTRDYTLAEIKQLRLRTDGSDVSRAVPTLQEALDFVDGRVLVVLGLKSYEVDSLAKAINGREKKNVLLNELVYSGTDQGKVRDAAEATELDIVVTLFRSQNYLTDLERIYEQLGPRIKMISVGSAKLTPGFLDRLDELGLRLMISGWAANEDRALVDDADPAPWIAALEVGFAASTDYPERLLEALGR